MLYNIHYIIYTILYYTILYYTILCYTILYYTILYYTTPTILGTLGPFLSCLRSRGAAYGIRGGRCSFCNRFWKFGYLTIISPTIISEEEMSPPIT